MAGVQTASAQLISYHDRAKDSRGEGGGYTFWKESLRGGIVLQAPIFPLDIVYSDICTSGFGFCFRTGCKVYCVLVHGLVYSLCTVCPVYVLEKVIVLEAGTLCTWGREDTDWKVSRPGIGWPMFSMAGRGRPCWTQLPASLSTNILSVSFISLVSNSNMVNIFYTLTV